MESRRCDPSQSARPLRLREAALGDWRPGAESEVKLPVPLPGPGEATGPHGGGLRQTADTTGLRTGGHLDI